MRKAETGDDGMYEGADLTAVTQALKDMASGSPNDHYRGASSLLAQPGAGPALVSGFLHFLHPERYALVNNASQAPFVKDGWLAVSKSQRTQAISPPDTSSRLQSCDAQSVDRVDTT